MRVEVEAAAGASEHLCHSCEVSFIINRGRGDEINMCGDTYFYGTPVRIRNPVYRCNRYHKREDVLALSKTSREQSKLLKLYPDIKIVYMQDGEVQTVSMKEYNER